MFVPELSSVTCANLTHPQGHDASGRSFHSFCCGPHSLISYIKTDITHTILCNADAERAGYKALAITVDAPHLGNRWADERNE